MKSPGTKIFTVLICLAVLGYFGIQGYRLLLDPMITAVAYPYMMEESVSVTGYVVRQEQALEDAGAGLLRLERAEGERVSAGGRIAQVYSDQAALDRQRELDELTARLEQLEYAAEAAKANESARQLDSQITEKLIALRRALTAGRMDAVTDGVSELESLVLRREYTYTDAEELNAQAVTLRQQIGELKAKTGTAARAITAPCPGIYSAVLDGYETVLTPEFLETVTPSALSALQPTGATNSTGKLVLGDQWYYAATLPAGEAARLTVGAKETLRFAKGVDRDLEVTVQSISQQENGRVAVVFRGDVFLSEVTLLRQQSADVILESHSGLRVPQEAVRVNEEGVTGVYCVVGATARFKPVKVLWSGEGFALVRPEGQRTLALLSGEQVIVTTAGITDGAVVS